MWTDYDIETDVLYISFRKPQQANEGVMEGDGNTIIIATTNWSASQY